MLRDFRIGWRLLLQQPAYSLVVTGGLAVGFAACFLLFGYVAYCLDYNSHVPDNGRLVVIKNRVNIFPRPVWSLETPLNMRDAVLNGGLASAASIAQEISGKAMRAGAETKTMRITVVDPVFARMFALSALEGDLLSALTQPDGVALTRTGAARLFGSHRALGQSVYYGDQLLQVRAVLADPPVNSNERYEALVGSLSSIWPDKAKLGDGNVMGRLYIELKPGASLTALSALLQGDIERLSFVSGLKDSPVLADLKGRNLTDLRLLPVRDIYFDDELAASGSDDYGRRSSVFGLAAGGMLILALATINYTNLATVRTLRRQREIGLRKLLGASTGQLVRQFISEAILVAMLAALAGLLLAWLLLPAFSGLVNRELGAMFTPWHALAALGFSIVIGLAAGAYPAWLAQNALPAAGLAGRGNSETVSGLWLRRVLTVLQFASAMALSAGTLAVGWQTWYASHASPGFDTRHILLSHLPWGIPLQPAGVAFIEQLRRVPGIEGVATMNEAVGRDGNKTVASYKGKAGQDVALETKGISPDWFDVTGVRPLLGRAFDPRLEANENFIMLNHAGALALGFDSAEQAVGQSLPNGQQIIGIVPDIRFQGLHTVPQPLLFRAEMAGILMLKTHATQQQAYAAIEPVWRRHFPNDPLQIKPQQTVIADRYADDARLMRLLAITSATAIALAAFGIYVLSAYSVQRQQRQIVLRKLHGAAPGDIALMLTREFAVLVGVAAVIGLPPAAVATQRYLANYPEHAPIGGWTLAAALLLAVLVALLATTRHTWAAMRMAPVLALKD